jgi:hypothetical protein
VSIVLHRRFAGLSPDQHRAMQADVARVLGEDPAFRARLRGALLAVPGLPPA